MAISRFNWATLLGIDEEFRRRLEESFSTINRNNNWANKKSPMHSYMNNSDQDSDEMDRANTYDDEYLDEEDNSNENSTQHSRQYSSEEEIDKRRYIKKKLVKKQKTCIENEMLTLPVTKEKELTIESRAVPVNNFYRPNKHQLREAILWAEVLAEPKCKKRHRK